MSEEIKEQPMQETIEAEDREQAEEEQELPSDTAESPLETDDGDDGPIIYDADAEDALEAAAARASEAPIAGDADSTTSEDANEPHNVRSMAEMMAIIESLIFVSEEPLSTKA